MPIILSKHTHSPHSIQVVQAILSIIVLDDELLTVGGARLGQSSACQLYTVYAR